MFFELAVNYFPIRTYIKDSFHQQLDSIKFLKFMQLCSALMLMWSTTYEEKHKSHMSCSEVDFPSKW